MEIQITRAVALISINATIITQLLSFLIFMMLISRLMYRPLQEIMTERDRQFEQMKEDIKTATGDLENIRSMIDAETNKVKEEAFAVQKQLEKDAGKQSETIFSEVNAEIARLSAETQKEVDRQLVNARKGLAEESERVALALIEKVLNRRLT
jgi:F-type H+-transporting ATPase subunit b